MGVKDWKKISSSKYVNKKRDGTLTIFGNEVGIEIDTVRIQGINFPQTHIYEVFDSKQEALSYAKDYMREN